jgi:hypothetical protein
MDEEPFQSERPPDERWWERELHRNEKLMDRYMSVLGDNPDWDKWQNPEDLYNKVHFDIDPPDRLPGDAANIDEEEDESDEAVATDLDEPPANWSDDSDEGDLEEAPDPEELPEVNENYGDIATVARRFACAVFDLEDVPGNPELLFLSAGKIGANLAGGHGLGYDDESICGNIVKCRWALSDCEFCREMLEQLLQKTGENRYAELIDESRRLADVIRDRIARLRNRVWW